MTRVSVEVPAELIRPIRETVLLLYQATAESLHLALKARESGDDAVMVHLLHRSAVTSTDTRVIASACHRGTRRQVSW